MAIYLARDSITGFRAERSFSRALENIIFVSSSPRVFVLFVLFFYSSLVVISFSKNPTTILYYCKACSDDQKYYRLTVYEQTTQLPICFILQKINSRDIWILYSVKQVGDIRFPTLDSDWPSLIVCFPYIIVTQQVWNFPTFSVTKLRRYAVTDKGPYRKNTVWIDLRIIVTCRYHLNMAVIHILSYRLYSEFCRPFY